MNNLICVPPGSAASFFGTDRESERAQGKGEGLGLHG